MQEPRCLKCGGQLSSAYPLSGDMMKIVIVCDDCDTEISPEDVLKQLPIDHPLRK